MTGNRKNRGQSAPGRKLICNIIQIRVKIEETAPPYGNQGHILYESAAIFQ